MVKILGKHKLSTDLIRSLSIDCLSLDLVAFNLFIDGIHADEADKTKDIYEEKLSSSLLNLAVAVRTLLYQGHIDLKCISYCGFYESDNPKDRASVTIKDICDKIIHAESLERELESSPYPDNKPVTTIKGSHGKSEWVMDISVSLFCESVLNWVNELDCT
jgi:hypothetical protein